MEEWRDIPGYEGWYQVSNLGRVRSMRRISPSIMSPSTYNGYHRVNLSNGGKYTTIHIHRLVAMVFLPNPYNYPQVNHLDGNRQNNNINNLEWCSRSQNQIHAYRVLGRARPRCRSVIQMDDNENILNMFESISQASRYCNVSVTTIREAILGKINHAAGFKWRFK